MVIDNYFIVTIAIKSSNNFLRTRILNGVLITVKMFGVGYTDSRNLYHSHSHAVGAAHMESGQ